MVVLELDQVEIDYCPDCCAVWLDEGELDLLLGSPEAARAFLETCCEKTQAGESPKRCPVCRKLMDKVLFDGEPKVLVDQCPRKEGLWFDRGELEMVLQRGAAGKETRVLALLRDMLGNPQGG